MITIVDYGMGNLRNVVRGFREIGENAEITSEPAVIGRASALILPGVGAFGEAVKRIDALGLREEIARYARSGKPLLGICLGMQLLFDESEETPGFRGLGLLEGNVERFGDDVKVPHIGWNDVDPVQDQTVLLGAVAHVFYFVHSYFVPVGPHTIGVADYGRRFSAAVRKENIFGVQFHPEKSQRAGLDLLRRFAAIGT